MRLHGGPPAAPDRVAIVTGAEAEGFAAVAQAASPLVCGAGVHRATMSIMRTEALVCYRINHREHERRVRADAGAVSSPDVLELLLGLPVAMPVPVSSLTGRERTALRLAPRGSVSIENGAVTRHAVAPVHVELAVVAARTWRGGLETAGRFAPYCARAMVLHRSPDDVAQLRLEGEFYGVGVIAAGNGAAEVLVQPAPFHRLRFTAAGWRFLEDVYRRGSGHSAPSLDLPG